MHRQKATTRCASVAADPGPVVKGFQGRADHARVLIAERDLSMDIVADRLNSAPSSWRVPKEISRHLGQSISFAIPASEQEEQIATSNIVGALQRLVAAWPATRRSFSTPITA